MLVLFVKNLYILSLPVCVVPVITPQETILHVFPRLPHSHETHDLIVYTHQEHTSCESTQVAVVVIDHHQPPPHHQPHHPDDADLVVTI